MVLELMMLILMGGHGVFERLTDGVVICCRLLAV